MSRALTRITRSTRVPYPYDFRLRRTDVGQGSRDGMSLNVRAKAAGLGSCCICRSGPREKNSESSDEALRPSRYVREKLSC